MIEESLSRKDGVFGPLFAKAIRSIYPKCEIQTCVID
jgi:hypothetical protein